MRIMADDHTSPSGLVCLSAIIPDYYELMCTTFLCNALLRNVCQISGNTELVTCYQS